jgi:hypothetical protein
VAGKGAAGQAAHRATGGDPASSAVDRSGVAGTCRAAKQLQFVALAAFNGARAGYVFKKGARGLGYYLDGGGVAPPREGLL